MEIQKALEILKELSKGDYDGNVQDAEDAERLGIKALAFLSKHYSTEFLRWNLGSNQKPPPAPASTQQPLFPPLQNDTTKGIE